MITILLMAMDADDFSDLAEDVMGGSLGEEGTDE